MKKKLKIKKTPAPQRTPERAALIRSYQMRIADNMTHLEQAVEAAVDKHESDTVVLDNIVRILTATTTLIEWNLNVGVLRGKS